MSRGFVDGERAPFSSGQATNASVYFNDLRDNLRHDRIGEKENGLWLSAGYPLVW